MFFIMFDYVFRSVTFAISLQASLAFPVTMTSLRKLVLHLCFSHGKAFILGACFIAFKSAGHVQFAHRLEQKFKLSIVKLQRMDIL